MAQASETLKQAVHDFWNAESCGEVYAKGDSARERLEEHARTRYELEPYIFDFARFTDGRGKDVLEIGVGMGADHAEWAKAGPRSLTGVDLTERAVEHTRARLEALGLSSSLQVGDAERLPFADDSFDLVYSWGVLHHSPDTERALNEVWRVLRPGGTARIMIYHKHSVVGALLWLRYGLLAGRPGRGLDDIYHHHLESPGTKAYTAADARRMMSKFGEVRTATQLSFGDLLQGEVGMTHGGRMIGIVRRVWPRWLIRRAFRKYGLMLLIEARK